MSEPIEIRALDRYKCCGGELSVVDNAGHEFTYKYTLSLPQSSWPEEKKHDPLWLRGHGSLAGGHR